MEFCDLQWPLRSYLYKWKICVFIILAFIKKNQNRFINKCARKIKANIQDSHSFIVSLSHSFFVRCRSTYVLYIRYQNHRYYILRNVKSFLLFLLINFNDSYIIIFQYFNHPVKTCFQKGKILFQFKHAQHKL